MCSNLLPLISRYMLSVTIMNQNEFSMENILLYESEQELRYQDYVKLSVTSISSAVFMDFWNCTFPCNEVRVI